MKTIRLLLTAAFVASTSLFTVACDKTKQEETQDKAEKMEEAKDKAGVEPSGTENEAQDTPIEGTPEEVFGEMRREIDAYQDKIFSSSKDVPEDLLAKLESLSAQIDKMNNEMSVDELQAEEISDSAKKQIAQVKKEWNQTKRQIDVALGDTKSESKDSQE